MICPECGSGEREGSHCRSCGVDLEKPPPSEPDVALIKVYECGNAALVPLVKSLFADAGIQYMIKGEAIQNLFGWGTLGANLNYATGPVEFYVREDAAAEARALIESIEASEPLADDAGTS